MTCLRRALRGINLPASLHCYRLAPGCVSSMRRSRILKISERQYSFAMASTRPNLDTL